MKHTCAYVCIENAFISAVHEMECSVRKPRNCEEDLFIDSLEELMEKGKHVGATFMNRSRAMVSHLIKEANLDARERHILCNKYDIMLNDEPLSTQDLAEYYHMPPKIYEPYLQICHLQTQKSCSIITFLTRKCSF